MTGRTRGEAPGIPWNLIVGMRNILAHDYGGVDLEQVYRVVTESIPVPGQRPWSLDHAFGGGSRMGRGGKRPRVSRVLGTDAPRSLTGGRPVSSGIYFVKLKTGYQTLVQRVVVAR